MGLPEPFGYRCDMLKRSANNRVEHATLRVADDLYAISNVAANSAKNIETD